MRLPIPLLIALLAGPAFAQNPTPLDGSDVIVDAAGSLAPAVGSNNAGSFVVVWQESGIRAQRFNADGSTVGGVLTVAASGEQPDVAVADTGAFLVVWRDFEAGARRIKKRFYDANASPTAAADVDADALGVMMGDVVADDAGNFVVVWSQNMGSYNYDVRSRVYDSTGSPGSAEVIVSSGTASDRAPRVAHSAGADGFIVVWDRETIGMDIHAQMLNAAAAPIPMGDFVVNTYTSLTQVRAEVARSREGSFVVAWDGAGSEDPAGIFARRFAADGTALGDQFIVNSYTTANQQRARVIMDGSSNAIFAWTSFGSPNGDSSDNSIQARGYFADGTALGPQFQVNTYTTQNQTAPHVAMLGGGDFVVTWQRQFDAVNDIRMRRYASVLGIFSDGFESGTSNAWSAAVP